MYMSTEQTQRLKVDLVVGILDPQRMSVVDDAAQRCDVAHHQLND